MPSPHTPFLEVTALYYFPPMHFSTGAPSTIYCYYPVSNGARIDQGAYSFPSTVYTCKMNSAKEKFKIEIYQQNVDHHCETVWSIVNPLQMF